MALEIPGQRGLHFQHRQAKKQDESRNSTGGKAMFCLRQGGKHRTGQHHHTPSTTPGPWAQGAVQYLWLTPYSQSKTGLCLPTPGPPIS